MFCLSLEYTDCTSVDVVQEFKEGASCEDSSHIFSDDTNWGCMDYGDECAAKAARGECESNPNL